jgi:uncharacterized protein (TIGR02145 family)
MKNTLQQFSLTILVVLFFGCSTSSDGNANSNAINIPGPNVTDIDGNIYQSVKICNQTWTKSNLNVSKYTDGTPIPQVTNPYEWASITTGVWCYYENNTANGSTYGKLYNWYAVMGIYNASSAANPELRKKLAPLGWHIPTDAEWNQLTDCLGGESLAGAKMKSIGTIQAGTGIWNEPNTEATNSSGFSGLPAGYLATNGSFWEHGFKGEWWSSSENEEASAWLRQLIFSDIYVYSYPFYKNYGFSVRCVKD